MACHNGLVTPAGENVSIGADWRASMMANSSRDPYWQAAVRRETIDHPKAQEAIQDECAKCHMPMARFESRTAGHSASVFAHLPIGSGVRPADRLAADGVSCTVCHQIADEKLGSPESFTGGFSLMPVQRGAARPIYGPFKIEEGHTAIMRSATGFEQTESKHIQKSEFCATCHTLFTKALGSDGQVIGELPEQTPYQEWLHSGFRTEKSCQDCHMPVVKEPSPITSILGEPREGLSRHDFRGANSFMIDMLRRFRGELGVEALPEELELASKKTRENLERETAQIAIERVEVAGGRLEADVVITNLAGHKAPTAYPSRRVWVRFSVRDRSGRVVFESGALTARGSIIGNDNDADAARFEPHHDEIRTSEQVQIYESVMADSRNAVTTGLLSAVRYVKDNRLLPKGFEKGTAANEIAVHGSAVTDDNFIGGSDRVRYIVEVVSALAPFTVEAELLYQSIGFRWAENLRPYNSAETKRFVGYYESMASASAVVVARAVRETPM